MPQKRRVVPICIWTDSRCSHSPRTRRDARLEGKPPAARQQSMLIAELSRGRGLAGSGGIVTGSAREGIVNRSYAVVICVWPSMARPLMVAGSLRQGKGDS